jgi:hypothetical protein
VPERKLDYYKELEGHEIWNEVGSDAYYTIKLKFKLFSIIIQE